MQLELERIAYTDRFTLGQMNLPRLRPTLFTLERPWRRDPDGAGGQPKVSCVPDGTYRLLVNDSPNHPGTYRLVNEELGVYRDVLPPGQAWGRTAIDIHKANKVEELLGCIAVGLRWEILGEEMTVLRSGDALAALVDVLGRDEEHVLVIRPTRGTTP